MGYKVNFSTEEAESKSYVIPPSGEYTCAIFAVTDKDVQPPSDNAGKPYWNVRFKISDGEYSGNNIFANIMLFSGKNGTLGPLSQFLKAVGYEITAGDFEVPDNDDLVGKSLLVRGVKKKPETVKNKELQERFQITGYRPLSQGKSTSGVDSLLP